MSKGINKNSMSSLLEGLTSVRSTTPEDNHQPNPSSHSKDEVTSIPADKPISKGGSKERICTSVDKNVMNKIRTISETEGIQINELITLGLDMVISKYEEAHGPVRPKKINKGNIDNIFR